MENKTNDFFTQIASGGIGGKKWLLTEPTPVNHPIYECQLLEDNNVEYSVPERSYDREGLACELKSMRERVAPFLEDHTPKLRAYTSKVVLDRFVLDGREEVSIPHYGGPIGRAKKTYETVVNLHKKTDKAYYFVCKGADYHSVVYVNGVCVGTHEGFFAPFEFLISESLRDGGKNDLDSLIGIYETMWKEWKLMKDTKKGFPTLYVKESTPLDLKGYFGNTGFDIVIEKCKRPVVCN